MPRKKVQPKTAPRGAASAFERAWQGVRSPSEPPPTVSARWLLAAAALALAAAVVYSPSPAPEAQCLLAPRFSVGLERPFHPESWRDGAHSSRSCDVSREE
jgi:hypothetical protein